MVNEDDMSDPSGLVNNNFVRFIEHALKHSNFWILINNDIKP